MILYRRGARHQGLVALATFFGLAILLINPGRALGACPNEAYRTGASASLPDCRAYELVTPPGTNGRDLTPIRVFPSNLFPTELASAARDSVIYMAPGTPLETPSGPTGTYDLYEAVRNEGTGWETTRRLSPSGEQAVFPEVGGVSSDHGYAFYQVGPVQGLEGGTLAAAGTSNYLGNPDGSFELIGVGSQGTERLAHGKYISPAGNHIVFVTGGPDCLGGGEPCPIAQLEPNAPEAGTAAVYERSADGPTRVVSLLPDNSPPAAGENASYQGTSTDGSAIAFKIGVPLYVRIDGTKTEEVTSGEATFAGLAGDGSSLFYVQGENVFRFDTETEATAQVTSSGDAQVVHVSPDGSHVYFISPSLLDGSKGTAGEPNLYVWDDVSETDEFIATVSPADVSGGLPSLNNWTSQVVNPEPAESRGPGADSSRTTPDGGMLAFESRAKLTSYENEGHVEIYLYDDGDKSLICASCNPTGAPPTFDARFEAINEEVIKPLMIVHNLSQDGNRVFFETTEALTGRDVDNANDIYEWHRASAGATPEISLISSGHTPTYFTTAFGFPLPVPTNMIFSITPEGRDVVFSSREQLDPAAGRGGALGIYDARIDGGFPSPPLPPECVGEGCQPSSAPPDLQTPSSSGFKGRGNVRKHRRRCRPKHSGRKRCHRSGGHQHRHHRPTGSKQKEGAK